MAGMESVQQLQNMASGAQMSKSMSVTLDPKAHDTTHLPKELAGFLQKKGDNARPHRLAALSARVNHTRSFPNESITNKRIRQFSLFPKAKNLI